MGSLWHNQMTNQIFINVAKELKEASKKNNALIWKKLRSFILKPSSSRRIVNLTKIDKITKDNDVLFVPGKVLGTGNISHKILLCSFS